MTLGQYIRDFMFRREPHLVIVRDNVFYFFYTITKWNCGQYVNVHLAHQNGFAVGQSWIYIHHPKILSIIK